MNRKIPLDIEIYHPLTGGSYGGDEDCDHDYPPEPYRSEDTYACWRCTKCSMERCYDVHD